MSHEQDGPLLTPELLAALERLELAPRKVFRGRLKGERRSKRRGESVEFADFRSYVPGDDLRFIDWNTYARLERLFLKLFLEEEDLHFYALIDASASMGFGRPSKLHYAKQIAAALGFIGLQLQNVVTVLPVNRNTLAQRDVAGNRIARHRVTTVGDLGQQITHTFDVEIRILFLARGFAGFERN